MAAGASAPAAAKVNLALHILGRRADGYHAVETLIAFAAVADRVTVRAATEPSLLISGPFAAALAGEAPERNLAWRAAGRFAAAFGGPPRGIALDKQLPVAAGLGGGSADAAAVLRLLAGDAGIPLEEPRLVAIAGSLGADVHACLAGGPCIARGIGELLEPLDAFPTVPVLLVNPGVAVPTAAVFGAWAAGAGVTCAPIDRAAIEAAGDGPALAAALAGTGNMLEEPATAIAPEVAVALDALRSNRGCLLARMSGSGATCFGLFRDDDGAAAAAQQIGRRFAGWWLAPSRLQGSGPVG